MIRIAVSGHRGLSTETTRLIDHAIRLAISAESGDVLGLSCLADGADQLFARAVADLGGRIEAVVPAELYRDGLPEQAHQEYDKLLGLATEIHVMPFRESSSESHMAASEFMIDHADELYAVWDGQPARSYGGTADVVAYARQRGIPVQVIWPDGAERD